MNKTICFFVTCMALLGCCQAHAQEVRTFRNPLIDKAMPDPTVILAPDGYYYLYATENVRNMPIYKSKNLLDWEFVGTVFKKETRPQWNSKGALWAPDINYINGRYVLYYAKSVWGGEWTCGIGVAVADRPEGPFKDFGCMFTSEDIEVQNSIDAFYIQENGRNYLFWGSFHGIYGIELSQDGLTVKEGAQKVRIAGDFMEGTYIHKHGGFYYLFGSAGTCCEGDKSTYRVVYGRSKELFGPYVTKKGEQMLQGHYDLLLSGSEQVNGPGHNAEFITDDNKTDWMIYHGFKAGKAKEGRVVYMDRVEWIDGWPHIAQGKPSVVSEAPVVGAMFLADPTIFYDKGMYYLYGTGASKGFQVYQSKDLLSWEGPVGAVDGYALCGNAYGTKGFWAPQVFKHEGAYYMAYTADSQIAIARSDSPLGPFTQEKPAMIPATTRQIDPFVFFDDNGKAYLYHVRVSEGNRIFVAELNKDFTAMKEKTVRECISADSLWEDTAHAEWKVCEGPTVLKTNGTYYLFYSCNDFRNIDYAVGYATASSPLGPWTKQGEAMLSRQNIGWNGTGHGDLFRDADGQWQYVFHTHNGRKNVSPRRTAMVTLQWNGNGFSVIPESFRFIHK